MPKYYAVYMGTDNDSGSIYVSDVKEFDTKRALCDWFDGVPDDRFYVHPPRDTPDNGGPGAWVFGYDPVKWAVDNLCTTYHSRTGETELNDLYPDYILSFGPRGGIHMTRA